MELTRSQKRIILMLADATLIYFSGYVAYFFLSEYVLLSDLNLIQTLTGVAALYFVIGLKIRLFSIINRYTDYKTLSTISLILIGSYFITFLTEIALSLKISYRFLLLSCMFSVLFTISMRLGWRMWYSFKNGTTYTEVEESKVSRTLVVGAGDGGSLFITTALKDSPELKIVAVVDRDVSKQGSLLHGIKVVGTDEQIPEIVANYEISQIVVAIPSLKPDEYERILSLCKKTGAKVSAMPKYEEVVTGKLKVHKLREIDIADLLGRKEVKLDQTSLQSNIEGKTVLVTGAGGSIGSELCRQIVRFSPARLLLLGHGENSIYLIHKELTTNYGEEVEIVPIIADIQDRERIFHIMKEYRPDRVYHAAAHKHVPLMEYNPTEAVKNNIYGTRNVAEAAKAAGVAKFVMVSTDKAVNPPNVMGATKRVAEMIVTSLNEEGKTLFAAVRFGNVLGSRGSVVPLFKEQIANGGPITVTDFRMTRYFMTIPEASRLVIQAGALMHGGEIFVLDMGEPVKILDLAKKMITLSGHTEEEIQIVETGIRPGEKLYEELLSNEERVDEQIYEKIFVGNVQAVSNTEVDAFIQSISNLDGSELKEKLVEFAQQ
ncbi:MULTISPECIES: polysaccharide biosynthesis protein [Streptococcus]|uniref:polysaccharide biosynthesis protein n=1 Tax=Streptococcus TaxID=1301 RepID=UPI0007814197|nr:MULTISPECIES: nucleoside-diphosphate sugar epimerase/dehydratase [Streptococcus]MCF1283507.1 polysaccharide biosynthesis protein [Streptococcus sinensis]MCY7218415.1 polysaccharide biosynthesis protein [Streptococcus cristatus]